MDRKALEKKGTKSGKKKKVVELFPKAPVITKGIEI